MGQFLLFIVLAAVGFCAQARAEAEYVSCATQNSQVCVQLKFESAINSTSEAKFTVAVATPDSEAVQDFKVSLWMDMGHGHMHGSAPVQVSWVSQNLYKVEKAWFVMSGKWLVRESFSLNGSPFQIDIPVVIEN